VLFEKLGEGGTLFGLGFASGEGVEAGADGIRWIAGFGRGQASWSFPRDVSL
jgi:hypothetical protein